MKPLLLFDFDGVLVDSIALYEYSVNLCLDRIGEKRIEDREAFLDLFEHNFYEGIARRGIDAEQFMKASRALTPTLDYTVVSPHREMIPVLRELKKTRTLVVISSNSSYAIRLMMSDFGFDGCFAEVLGADFHVSKVEKIRVALERYGPGANGAYYICDTAGDILEAKAAGVETVAVTWGWHSRERLEKAVPDRLIDRPEDLLLLP